MNSCGDTKIETKRLANERHRFWEQLKNAAFEKRIAAQQPIPRASIVNCGNDNSHYTFTTYHATIFLGWNKKKMKGRTNQTIGTKQLHIAGDVHFDHAFPRHPVSVLLTLHCTPDDMLPPEKRSWQNTKRDDNRPAPGSMGLAIPRRWAWGLLNLHHRKNLNLGKNMAEPCRTKEAPTRRMQKEGTKELEHHLKKAYPTKPCQTSVRNLRPPPPSYMRWMHYQWNRPQLVELTPMFKHLNDSHPNESSTVWLEQELILQVGKS